ncbi:hypothetical protein N7489_005071 [Penicillium chrysogenum]|uniref:Mannan endo-1,6-alpha-mannosidase n=1 Tax=Penicillium chrysogenum TaxID=5076 RepID=A0ABQ8WDQ2_PENCH|nr:uncharacterized protein N7489_005071 [Penicillium chrysogenum]KAJ5244975.1 hypothetical protein N7489_005071 [Penicillium chrysogenum]KAJ5264766.1 hypothetical protein N7505_007559 [Penicillium chrysogenum]
MYALLSVVLIPIILGAGTSAQSATSKAETALDVLQTWYNGSTGIWDTSGWWNGANCMTVLAYLALTDENETVRKSATEVFNNTFVVGSKVNPHPNLGKVIPEPPRTGDVQALGIVKASNWTDGSFDDDSWWALAWIAAYDVTKNQDYLDLAIGIFDHLTSDGPTTCSSGGIYSDYNHDYVNAITNELFLSVAAHLANRVPNKEKYVGWAQRQWKWFQASGMINDQGIINDGLTDCKNSGQPIWSYNQGVVLGGLVELDRAAPDPSYLKAASRIAKAAIETLADPNDVIHDICEPNSCDANARQFKGIFIRNLGLLHSVTPNDGYVKVIRACAESIWAHDRNSTNNQLGVDWGGPITKVDASTHSSAMDALVAAIAIS